jgi:hypothetical protein
LLKDETIAPGDGWVENFIGNQHANAFVKILLSRSNPKAGGNYVASLPGF